MLPFEPNDSIQATNVIDLEQRPSGMQGSGYEFLVWSLGPDTKAIAAATSENEVRNNLFWHQTQTPQFKQALGILGREPQYAKVSPMIAGILAAPDLRFAWTEYSFNEQPPYVAVWICSPSSKKIAYLHVY